MNILPTVDEVEEYSILLRIVANVLKHFDANLAFQERCSIFSEPDDMQPDFDVGHGRRPLEKFLFYNLIIDCRKS
jgi:hypothetical protein